MMSGITTMIGGGTGPAAGTSATTCTPGPWHLGRMYQALEELPINFGLLGKGNVSLPLPLAEQIEAPVSAFVEHAIGKMVTICRAIRVARGAVSS